MNEARNQVVRVRHFGGPDELEVVDAPVPTAGRGQVRVRVLASGVEYTDVVIRRHLYPQTMLRRPPFVMGYDVVGEIDQLGDGVSGPKRESANPAVSLTASAPILASAIWHFGSLISGELRRFFREYARR